MDSKPESFSFFLLKKENVASLMSPEGNLGLKVAGSGVFTSVSVIGKVKILDE